MSWTKRTLITFAFVLALLALPVVGVLIYDMYERVQNERFYDDRPMLRKMKDVQDMQNPQVDFQRKELLLSRLPLGSSRSQAIDILSAEGMNCGRPIGSAQQNLMICTVRSPRVRWHIEVEFDGNEKVSNGRVLWLKP